MQHSFDIDVAAEVGITAAVIFNNFSFWILHNEKNNLNFHDGQHWVYNSNKAMAELFPYLTQNQITTAISKLREAGYLITGNYNDNKHDRTLWYAFGKKAKCILEKTEMETEKNQNRYQKNPKCLKDNIPDIKQDIKECEEKPTPAPAYPKTVDEILAIAASPLCGMRCTDEQAGTYLANRAATDWEDAARRKIKPHNIPWDLKRWLIRDQRNDNNKQKDYYSNGKNLSNDPEDFPEIGEY